MRHFRPFTLSLLLALALACGVADSLAATPAPTSAPAAGTTFLPATATVASQDQAALQALLKASNEEWGVIYPKLLQIDSLRAEVYAAGAAGPANNGFFSRLLNGPIGGTSMDAPTMANNRWAGRSPFDPARAPGSPQASINAGSGGLGRGLGRAMGNSLRVGQGNSVQILVAELRTLLNDAQTNDKQLFDKLTAIRAARARAVRDLAAAQEELQPLLTLDQQALLVSLGLID